MLIENNSEHSYIQIIPKNAHIMAYFRMEIDFTEEQKTEF